MSTFLPPTLLLSCLASSWNFQCYPQTLHYISSLESELNIELQSQNTQVIVRWDCFVPKITCTKSFHLILEGQRPLVSCGKTTFTRNDPLHNCLTMFLFEPWSWFCHFLQTSRSICTVQCQLEAPQMKLTMVNHSPPRTTMVKNNDAI